MSCDTKIQLHTFGSTRLGNGETKISGWVVNGGTFIESSNVLCYLHEYVLVVNTDIVHNFPLPLISYKKFNELVLKMLIEP